MSSELSNPVTPWRAGVSLLRQRVWVATYKVKATQFESSKNVHNKTEPQSLFQPNLVCWCITDTQCPKSLGCGLKVQVRNPQKWLFVPCLMNSLSFQSKHGVLVHHFQTEWRVKSPACCQGQGHRVLIFVGHLFSVNAACEMVGVWKGWGGRRAEDVI